ncbi:MAG: hypothetical protein H0U86_14930 [Chloroflexi bacterium]|nr:hypothetical protein [Chloroflexota bacterium]
MTPTLAGRWQTRTAMLATLGLFITLTFAVAFESLIFFPVLFWVFAFGLVWDALFIALQALRWDRDWPAVFQAGAGVIEGALVFLLITFVGLPGIDKGSVPLWLFSLHYGTVWLLTFAWVQGPMRALFPFWRFHGGRLMPVVAATPSSRRDRRDLRRRGVRRPSKITGSALVFLVGGIAGLAYGILLLLRPELLAGAILMSDMEQVAEAVRQASAIIAIVTVVLSVLYVLVGIGLMAGRGWARVVAIILAVLTILFSSLALVAAATTPVAADAGNLLGTLVTVAVYLLILVALFTSSRYFHAHHG